MNPLAVRWLGSVRYRDALALQQKLFTATQRDYLLLLEHPHVFTLGVRADLAHLLVDPEEVGADLERANRGGDITYHGPGQLVGYPILTVPGRRGGGMADTVAYVRTVEELLIDTLDDLGLPNVGRIDRYPGVWVDPTGAKPRKIAAIGVRLSRGRSMHGFALNVDPDMSYFDHIVPCGISDLSVTSLASEGIEVEMKAVVDCLVEGAVKRWGIGGSNRADLAWRLPVNDLSAFSRGAGPGDTPRPVRLLGRLAEAGVSGGIAINERKPPWMRATIDHGAAVRSTKRQLTDLDLVTVCEEAGCPNLSECWADGTATFMINGDRCTRACGFCMVDTRRPEPPLQDEPDRVAEAVHRLRLDYAVVTAVARDDLSDGGANGFVRTIQSIRSRCPESLIEVLIPDCRGEPQALEEIFAARPDVLNHNLETVLRLQRVVRPGASYARSLSVLSRAGAAGLVTKSGLILGMGETLQEVHQALEDLRAVGVEIVTIGQYLRPTTNHLPVQRWWTPEEFEELGSAASAMGFARVESSPFTRSSHHAKQSFEAAIEARQLPSDLLTSSAR